MKYLITFLAVFMINIASYSEVIRTGDTFKVEQTVKDQSIKTKYIWEDQKGNKYPIYITKKGTCYIIKISKKTGKEYRQYLPKDIQETIKKEIKNGSL